MFTKGVVSGMGTEKNELTDISYCISILCLINLRQSVILVLHIQLVDGFSVSEDSGQSQEIHVGIAVVGKHCDVGWR